MNNYKISRDRIRVSSKEIAQRKDFDSLLNDFAIMNRPFYKSPWFFGVTGMATLGLLIGGIYSFNTIDTTDSTSPVATTDNPPPEQEVVIAQISQTTIDEVPKETEVEQQKKNKHGKIITFDPNHESKKDAANIIPAASEVVEPISEEMTIVSDNTESALADIKTKSPAESDPRLSILPRIVGKIGGTITKEDLEDEKGLYTEAGVEVIGFQLHVATGLGSKVLETEGNQLSNEMIDVIHELYPGEEIYFEKILGRVEHGQVVTLPPVKFNVINTKK